MKIKVEYSEKEVSEIIIKHHQEAFGLPPHETRWITRTSYSNTIVENCPEETKKETMSVDLDEEGEAGELGINGECTECGTR